MQRYRVQIPAGVGPGMPFIVNVAGQQMVRGAPAPRATGMANQEEASQG